jgi:GH24 family phage-related lysozyme (muramidase)
MIKKLSSVGVNLIKNFEGVRLFAYKPVKTEQFWTIGYGHYGADVKSDMIITQLKAEEMLLIDLQKYEAYVNNPKYCSIANELNQNQFDALVSFCYNCGAGNLENLTHGKTLQQISVDILLYNKAGGNILEGLVKRRKTEQELFLKGVDQMTTTDEKIQSLEKRIQELEKLNNFPIPEWAIQALEDFKELGLIKDVKGSYDFYRFIEVLHSLQHM